MRPHFLTELRKSASDKLGKCSRTLLLNDCVSWMTAIGNDCSYEDVFLWQLENFGLLATNAIWRIRDRGLRVLGRPRVTTQVLF
jgi:hypothetical protein